MEDQRGGLLSLEQPTGYRVDPRRFAIQVTLAIVLAWLPVPVTVLLGRPAGWAATLLLALLVWGFCGRGDRFVLAVGFIASSALSASGLVTPQTIYQPVVVTGAAFALAAGAPILRDRRLPALPPAPVLAALGAYLAWAAVSTAFSIDRRSSLVYLVGMLVSLVATFVVLPAAVEVLPAVSVSHGQDLAQPRVVLGPERQRGAFDLQDLVEALPDLLQRALQVQVFLFALPLLAEARTQRVHAGEAALHALADHALQRAFGPQARQELVGHLLQDVAGGQFGPQRILRAVPPRIADAHQDQEPTPARRNAGAATMAGP